MRRLTGPHASIDCPYPWPLRPPPAHGSPRAWACAKPSDRSRAPHSSSRSWPLARTPSSRTGASGCPRQPRLQIGIALVSIGAAIGWLFSRTLSLRASTEAWIGVGLLLGFAVWCGVTLLWSVAPDETWAQVNRGIAYTLVAVLAIAVGSSAPRAIERVATGWLVVAIVCALYALGGKLIPGVEVLGVSFDHTAFASRLREPLQYWNALGLVCVLAVPIALRMTTDVARRPAVRCAALGALFVLLTCLGMTYSRGGHPRAAWPRSSS